MKVRKNFQTWSTWVPQPVDDHIEDLGDGDEGQAELLGPIDLSFWPIDDHVEDLRDVDECQE